MLERVERRAGGWAAIGVTSGDLVAVVARNSSEYLIETLALMRAGAVPALVNWRLGTAELEDLFALLGPVAVLADPISASMIDAIGRPEHRIVLGEDERPGWVPAASRDGTPPPRPVERLGASSTVAILHTSGTTGRPKAIPLTNGALIRSLAGFAIEIGDMVAGSPQLQLMPMFHLAGLSQALQCLLTGGKLHVLPAFDANRVVDEIERNAIQFFTAAPTIIAALVDEVRGRPERPTLSSLREIQYGAAPMPEPLLRDAIDVLGCRFRQIYGMTEAQSFVSLLHPRDHVPGSPRLRTAGQVALGWEVRIVDHAGHDVAAGDPGELLIRSDALFPGYYRDPDATAAAFTEDGWYRTGDVGTLDQDGYLSIVDRAKDMVISGGENIYPAEVEAVLRGHPDVDDVAVIGIPDERWGERVHAVLVARGGTNPGPDEIIGWTRERLAHFKCPRSVELVDELPRNATGKILKRDLRDRHVTSTTDADPSAGGRPRSHG